MDFGLYLYRWIDRYASSHLPSYSDPRILLEMGNPSQPRTDIAEDIAERSIRLKPNNMRYCSKSKLRSQLIQNIAITATNCILINTNHQYAREYLGPIQRQDIRRLEMHLI